MRCPHRILAFLTSAALSTVSAAGVFAYDLTVPITSFAVEGIGELYLGDKAPTVQDLSVSEGNFTIQKISWFGVDDEGFINDPNPTYTITVQADDGYAFEYDSSGYIFGTVDGNDRRAKGTAETAKISYTYGNHDYLKERPDKVVLAEYEFELMQYSQADISLSPSVECSHSVKHMIESMKVSDISEDYRLPEGLSMDSEGHITGNVMQGEGVQPCYIESKLSNGETRVAELSFDIIPHVHEYTSFTDLGTGSTVTVCKYAELCGDEPQVTPPPHDEHIWGEWVSDGSDTHSRKCTGCEASQTQTHSFDEGTLIVQPTEEHDGVRRFTCTACGFEKNVSERYIPDTEADDTPDRPDDETTSSQDEPDTDPADAEDKDFMLGDVNADGRITVTDISLCAAHVKAVRSLSADAQKRADVTKDGRLTVTDISRIAACVKSIKPI